MQTYRSKSTADYTVKEKTLNGRPQLVIPVVMIREGVHHGSHGAIYHSAEELSKFPCSWDGIPVTVMHPQVDGQNVSANDPDVLQTWAVGKVFNTHMVGDKLKADVWIDKEVLETRFAETYEMIKAGEPIDVSVGVFSDEVKEDGTWNDEAYTAIAMNHRPDHLALLPGATGACSYKDGCGIRNNENTMENAEVKEKEIYPVMIQVNKIGGEITQLIDKVYQLLNSMDLKDINGNLRVWYNLDALYDGYLIYRKVQNNPTPNNNPTYYQQDYTVDENGVVTLTGVPEEVTKQVIYKKVSINTNIKKSMRTKQPCCNREQKIERIIQLNSRMSDEDKTWLNDLGDEELEKLISEPAEPQVNQVTREKAIEVLMAGVETADQFIALAPDALRPIFEKGLASYKEKRAATIEAIMANAAPGVFTTEILEKYSDDELDRFSKAFKPAAPAANYSALGEPTNNSQKKTEPEVMLPPML